MPYELNIWEKFIAYLGFGVVGIIFWSFTIFVLYKAVRLAIKAIIKGYKKLDKFLD